jgi:hypothetical protein
VESYVLRNRWIQFLSIFVFVLLNIFNALVYFHDTRHHSSHHAESLPLVVEMTKHSFLQIARTVHGSSFGTAWVGDLMEEAFNAPLEKQAELREALQHRVLPGYGIPAQLGFSNVQFIFPDDRVFLRLHRTTAFGDSLAERKTVQFANRQQRVTTEFENTSRCSGYRIVIPILDSEQMHAGVLSLTLDNSAFLSQLEMGLSGSVQLLMVNYENMPVTCETDRVIFRTWEHNPLYSEDAQAVSYHLPEELFESLDAHFAADRYGEEHFQFVETLGLDPYQVVGLRVSGVTGMPFGVILETHYSQGLKDLRTYFFARSFILSSILVLFLLLLRLRTRIQDILSVCADCGDVRLTGRDPYEQLNWIDPKDWVHMHGIHRLSHGLCPHCAQKLYPEAFEACKTDM